MVLGSDIVTNGKVGRSNNRGRTKGVSGVVSSALFLDLGGSHMSMFTL